jgi:hypothetical protein
MRYFEDFYQLQKLVRQWTGVIHQQSEYTYIDHDLKLLKSVTKKDWTVLCIDPAVLDVLLSRNTTIVRLYCEADDPIRTIQLDDIAKLHREFYEVMI